MATCIFDSAAAFAIREDDTEHDAEIHEHVESDDAHVGPSNLVPSLTLRHKLSVAQEQIAGQQDSHFVSNLLLVHQRLSPGSHV